MWPTDQVLMNHFTFAGHNQTADLLVGYVGDPKL